MKTFSVLAVIAALSAPLCPAGDTRSWLLSEFSQFEKSVLKNISLRSDGRMTLAPVHVERFDSSSAYLWAIRQDSKGNLYAGGGPGAKLYRIARDGAAKTLAEWEELEVHALAIDSRDQVFAATSPDGKVYRVGADGKATPFYSPKAKYIWAMSFSAAGDLYVATGDPGEVHRVAPDGQGAVFFKTGETHARSLALDRQGNLVVGTEPGGLVLRVSPSGEGFVLHQMPKREVTAVAAGPDGSIYAAAVGTRQAPGTLASPPPLPAPAPAQVQINVNPALPQRPAAPPPPTLSTGASAVTGGSEVYRILPDGEPRRVWSHAADLVYSIAFDAEGRPLLGTGNKGGIYRLDSDPLYTALLNAPPTQVTYLEAGQGGKIYAATGNAGKVYEIGPELEREGVIESETYDSGGFSYWGRLTFKGAAGAGRIAVSTRSGNLDRPQKNWSPWSPAIMSEGGSRVTSPAARFAQWKATLSREGTGAPPELHTVELAYLPKNVAPRITAIEATPSNYRFPAQSVSLAGARTLNLPAIGKTPSPPVSLDTSQSSMQYAKGYVGARWAAADDNGDTMIFKVEIRGARESEWKLLRDKVKEKQLSWDSTAFPDGEYRLRVTVSDLPSNPKETALSTVFEGEPFTIDNTPPRISALAATRAGGAILLKWKASDALTVIESAEYSLDGGDWMRVAPLGGVSDSKELEYELRLDGAAAGEHTIAVRVEDEKENQAAEKAVVR
jgi:sugar lactone lactonase YvrE